MEHMEGNNFFANFRGGGGGFHKEKSTIQTVFSLVKFGWKNRNDTKFVLKMLSLMAFSIFMLTIL